MVFPAFVGFRRRSFFSAWSTIVPIRRDNSPKAADTLRALF
jgi:hypothetical protein